MIIAAADINIEGIYAHQGGVVYFIFSPPCFLKMFMLYCVWVFTTVISLALIIRTVNCKNTNYENFVIHQQKEGVNFEYY